MTSFSSADRPSCRSIGQLPTWLASMPNRLCVQSQQGISERRSSDHLNGERDAHLSLPETALGFLIVATVKPLSVGLRNEGAVSATIEADVFAVRAAKLPADSFQGIRASLAGFGRVDRLCNQTAKRVDVGHTQKQGVRSAHVRGDAFQCRSDLKKLLFRFHVTNKPSRLGFVKAKSNEKCDLFQASQTQALAPK
jgi:hypothetical protein